MYVCVIVCITLSRCHLPSLGVLYVRRYLSTLQRTLPKMTQANNTKRSGRAGPGHGARDVTSSARGQTSEGWPSVQRDSEVDLARRPDNSATSHVDRIAEHCYCSAELAFSAADKILFRKNDCRTYRPTSDCWL